MSDLRTIMETIPTSELFDVITSRIQSGLEKTRHEGAVVCPVCKGLRMHYYRKEETAGIVVSCVECYNGFVYPCAFCGKHSKVHGSCICHEHLESIRLASEKKRLEKEAALPAISFDEYDGKLIGQCDEIAVDKDDFAEWYADNFDPEISEKRVHALVRRPAFSVDIQDIIEDLVGDNGYEDQINQLDLKSPLLKEIQEKIDLWSEAQGEALMVYSENGDLMVDLTALYEECHAEWKEKKENDED